MPRPTSYGRSLLESIRVWFPLVWYLQWKHRKGISWTPELLVSAALLFAWESESCLIDRFDVVRERLRDLFPTRRLGTTYTGYTDAWKTWGPSLRAAVAKRLQERIQATSDKHWRVAGWVAFAADGSRVECPRTQANKTILGCAGKKRTAPQLYLTSLQHMGTGSVACLRAAKRRVGMHEQPTRVRGRSRPYKSNRGETQWPEC